MTTHIHQVKVAPKDQRTHNGVVYPSKAECTRAMELDLLVMASDIRGWGRQVQIPLGADFRTAVDFVVFKWDGTFRLEEVKGVETTDFKTVRRLWPKYGPGKLHILKRTRTGWNTETLGGRP